MSENSVPATDRAIPALGAAIVIEAALTAWMPGTVGVPVLTFLLTALLPAAVGAHMLVCHRRDRFPALSMRLAFAALVGLGVAVVARYLATWHQGSSLFLLQPLAMTLANVGVPLLWGSALARHLHPADASLQKIGRVGAGLIQLGFVFEFVVRLRSWDMMQSMMSGADPAATGLHALSSLLDIAANVALLWASVQAMRTATDDETLLRRVRRTHRLLTWWIVLFPLQVLLFHVAMRLRGMPSDPNFAREFGSTLAHLLLSVTLLTATSFVVARWLRLQFATSPSPIPRSGGVE
jgi:hypothetical protein